MNNKSTNQISFSTIKKHRVTNNNIFEKKINYSSIKITIDQPNTDEDTVAVSIRFLETNLLFMVYLWLIAYLLTVLTTLINKYHILYEIIATFLLIGGTVLGIITVLIVWRKLCSNLKLMPRERIEYIRQHDVSIAAMLDDYIEYDSLPLLRRCLFWSLTFGLTLVCGLITEILLLFWLRYHLIGMWGALTPILIITILLNIYFYCVDTLTFTSCFNITLLTINLLLFAAKCHRQLPFTWLLISLPLTIVQIQWTVHLILIYFRYKRGLYHLEDYQIYCLLSFCATIFVTLFADVITSINEYTTTRNLFIVNENDTYNTPSLAKISWLTAVIFFTVTYTTTIKMEFDKIIKSKGFSDPYPLSYTKAGWEKSTGPGQVIYSLLLGSIRLKYQSLYSIIVDDITPSTNNNI